jgi:phosphate/phosphite/phosphonate ABC transporter binding protein
MAPLTLAVIASTTLGDQRAAVDEVCAQLSTVLGVVLAGKVAGSYAELLNGFETDRVQYAWMSPALLALGRERLRIHPLLSAVRDERADYRAVLFVDAKGPFESVRELHGKRVAWVDPASAAGYLVPRLHLAALGINPTRIFDEELFVGSHAEVARAVLDGRVHVGATYAHRPPTGQPIRRAGFVDVVPGCEVRVLEWTNAIPSDVIAGHGLIPRVQQRMVANAILDLAGRDDGRRALRAAFDADQFATTPRGALRPLWHMIRLARENGLLSQL